MSRRRTLARKRSKTIRNAIPVDFGVQSLEKRLLFTTFSAGQFAQTFEYEAEGGGVMRIAYFDVTFEAIGVSVDPKTDITAVGDLIPGGIKAPAAPIFAFNLFTIYVTQSAPDSYITVAPVARLTANPPPGVRADIPFGAGQPLLVNPDPVGGGKAITVTPGVGIGLGVLGAYTFGVKGGPAANIPIISVPDPGAFGIYPGNFFGDGLLHAGFYVPNNTGTGLAQDFNTFKFAGEVFGGVAISGNIQMFYAGSILTGNATGLSLPGFATSASATPNFSVGGDIQNLITSGDIGGSGAAQASTGLPSYDTGFAGQIGGKLGQLNELSGGFYGTMHVIHSPSVTGLTDATPFQQIEFKYPPPAPATDPFGEGEIFEGDFIGLPMQLPAPLFDNNTPAAAQYLGSQQTLDSNGNLAVNGVGQPIYDTEFQGTLQNYLKSPDPAEWYGISMLAGQTLTFTVSETDGFTGFIVAEVQDPAGRLIASGIASTSSGVFQIKTDRPGIYNVGLVPNNAFGDLQYLVKISGTGDQGFGVLSAPVEVSDMGLDGFLQVDNGDFGGIVTAGGLVSATLGPTFGGTAGSSFYAPSSIIVVSGNLRAVTALSIGVATATTLGIVFSDPLYLSVPNGNVGLLQTTGATNLDIMALESQFDPNYFLLPTPIYKTDDAFAHAIGGNIEKISAASTFYGALAVNAGIGTIDAANMATTTPSHIDVNADNTGNDGIIDLIDVPGQFGVLGAGPEFVTNTGGNIRYLNLTGGPIFLPTAFGGLTDFPVTYAPGATTTFTDDSGALFTLTATGPVALININNANGTVTQQSQGTQVTVLSYPVLDKAGLVPISISAVTPGGNVSAGSLTIAGTGASGAGSQVDVANISILGVGRPITPATTQASSGVVTTLTDANGNALLQQAVPVGGQTGITTGALTDSTDEYLSITGPATFNVLNVNASTLTGNAVVEISNATRGEIVNVNAPQGVGTIIVNGNLGFATPQATPAAVLPLAVIANGNTYPFVQQSTGVVIGAGFGGAAGDVLAIDVGGAAGNIEAGGTIQSLIVNFAQSNGSKKATAIPGQFDGIVGPILATRLLYVDVGQGLLPTGSGSVGFSGLFATGKIGIVSNMGNPNGDIRGNIVSGETDPSGVGIDNINIASASIIGSTIATIANSNFVQASIFYRYFHSITVAFNGTNFAPGQPSYAYDIGPITVSGLGGIIGLQILTGSVAAITVNAGGFGIFSSTIDGQSNGRLGSVSASGYGIRDSQFRSFGYIGPVKATGKGGLVPVTAYPIDVRPSDVPNTLDPFFGIIPSSTIDINVVLGTSALAPNIPNRTDTGVIEDDIFNGLNDFGALTAQKVRSTLPLLTTNTLPFPDLLNVPMIGTVFANSITFGGTVGPIRIFQELDGFQITAGSVLGLSLSSSVNRFGISVAGSIKSLIIHGNLGQYVTDPLTGLLTPDSYINAGGSDGTIGSVRVTGNMNANIYATGQIGSIIINGDLLGGVIAFGRTNALALGSLHVFGGIRNGALILNGSVGSIIANRTLGTSIGSLTVHGNANLISIGANHALHGSQMALALTVDGTLKNLVVYGTITGTVHTGLDLTHLTVTDDGSSPYAITGSITVGGRLGTAKISNGNVAANILVTGNIGSFTIARGNLNASVSLQSLIGNIGSFKTTGGLAYGVYGSILALNSNDENIDISGSVGDGVNPVTITANSGNIFRVRGNVSAGANIAVTTSLNELRVDGSVLAGATISGHPIKKQKIAGLNGGTIIAV